MIHKMLVWFKFAPGASDIKLRELVRNSYKNIEVVGRGTIKLDPVEVTSTDEWKAARHKAKAIVDDQK